MSAAPLSGNEPTNLREEVRQLRLSVAGAGRAMWNSWKPSIGRPQFADDALNLAHYIALRHHDLRPLQRELMRRGLSSLGRLESRVLVSLEMLERVLDCVETGVCPDHRHWPASQRRFARGEMSLARNTNALFGPKPQGRSGRILVTLWTEAAGNPQALLDLVRAGANAVRINCAHDDESVWRTMIANVREAARVVGRPIPVLMDLAGPKARTTAVHVPGGGRLCRGDRLRLVKQLSTSPVTAEIVCEPHCVLTALREGSEVAYDDGKLGGIVERIDSDGTALVHIVRAGEKGAKLKSQKGLNFPGTRLDLDPLTVKDRADLAIAVQHADMIGYSFVRNASAIEQLQSELARWRPNDWSRIGLIAKIETVEAVQNLPHIIVRAAGHQPFGIMIARGDLAVELGFARLAEMQEEMLWLCEAAAVPVIWATQVLEQMVKSGLPTRGEMTDAAMSSRAECVMLNKGPNVVDAVRVLHTLLLRMEAHLSKKTSHLRPLKAW